MKKLILLLFLFAAYDSNSQKILDELFGSSSGGAGIGNLKKIAEFRSEKQLDSIYRVMQVPVLVIGSYTYVPHDGCVVKRKSAGAEETRKRDGANEKRNSGGANEGRNASGDNQKRTSDGDSEGRDLAGSQSKRNKFGGFKDREKSGETTTRTKDASSASRTGDGDSAGRSGDGGAAGRSGDGGSAGRLGNGSTADRSQAGGTLQIQCKKIKDKPAFELINISEKAKIKVYDVMGLRENTGTIIDYY